MTARMRILEGEFQGELLFEGIIYPFSAIRNELGLSAAFDTSHVLEPPSDIDLFKALEEIVYDN